jgi:hypothetical protein
MQTLCLKNKTKQEPWRLINAFFSSQTLHLQKLFWGLLKDFTLPNESFDYAQLYKEVLLSLKLSTQELKLELDALMD